MTDAIDSCALLVELASQLLPADVLITEQAERIEDLEDTVARLQAMVGPVKGAAGAALARRATKAANARVLPAGACLLLRRIRSSDRRGTG